LPLLFKEETMTVAPAAKYAYRRFSLAERDRRWRKVRELMRRDGIAAIVAPQNPGNSTDWQADARYLSHCGGGADASIAVVFPLEGDVTAVATSAAERWGAATQDWVKDVREAKRRYGRVMAERLLELGVKNEKIGICGLSGTRTPEGTIMHGTYTALTQALPGATFIDTTDLLQEAREVKSEEEIAVLQDSVDIVERAVEAQTRAAQPGVPDHVVWAETMHALFSRGSELSVHFNWVADPMPGRTLTRPTSRPLVAGDVIVAELESSVIGYRAQQIRPVAVNRCDPVLMELSKAHADIYPELLDTLRPGTTVGQIIDKIVELGKRIRRGSGALSGAMASLIIHGRGLGDDRPLLLTTPEARPDYEATERGLAMGFPENGVYIVKPTIWTADKRYNFIWGDSVRVTKSGAKRMGTSPLGMIVSPAKPFTGWPTDTVVYRG
jgi:Xaa-Pro aminopeptidase